jgi:hypothetical protein
VASQARSAESPPAAVPPAEALAFFLAGGNPARPAARPLAWQRLGWRTDPRGAGDVAAD